MPRLPSMRVLEDERIGEEAECPVSLIRSSDQASTVICAKGPLRRCGQDHTYPRGSFALVLGATLLLAVACAPAAPADRSSRTGDPAPLRHPQLQTVRSFALGLGVDPLDRPALDRLGRYDLVVVDGSATVGQVAALHRRGALVLGYLSVGTVEPYRPWYREAKRHGWLLDRWEDWNEWYAQVDAAGYRDLLVDEARRQVSVGFDGLFLDNTDMVDTHVDQVDGMARAVAELDRAIGEEGVLFAQNGDAGVDRISGHLDGWNREDVSSTYDFDGDRYVAVAAVDRRAALDVFARLRSDGLLVTATDYTAVPDDDTVKTAAAAACRAGAIPFSSDIELTRIPVEPPTCPSTGPQSGLAR